MFELWGCSSSEYIDEPLHIPPINGSYVKGYLFLNGSRDFYLHVCSKGIQWQIKYSYGGGGPGQYGGGGASDVRLNSGTYNDFDSLKSRIIVAAGAGGTDSGISGGPGGGLIGYNSTDNHGKGGTQTQGGDGQFKGGFGYGGGNSSIIGDDNYAGGNGSGGSGYFGGGSSDIISNFGGGGGSSYIGGHIGCISVLEDSTESQIEFKTQGDVSVHYSGYRFERTEMIDGKHPISSPYGSIETGHYGNGFIRITAILLDYIPSCIKNSYSNSFFFVFIIIFLINS